MNNLSLLQQIRGSMRNPEPLSEENFYLAAGPRKVRCIDIAERMDVTLPSVSRAVKELEKMGYLTRDEDGSVTLTPSGERIATEIYERHRFFTQRLIAAGVDPETAAKEACHMDHGVSEESFQKLREEQKGERGLRSYIPAPALIQWNI